MATTTIFTTMTALAEETGAINLGQGFPDGDGPAVVVDAAAEALRAGHNQYAPLPGVPALRAAIADHQRRHYGIELDPATQVQVTFGATEALASALLGAGLARRRGGDARPLLRLLRRRGRAGRRRAAADRRCSRRAGAWTPRPWRAWWGTATRVLLLNTPHNPTGHVLDAEELDLLADACRGTT